ncbi:MAG: hypothetical protein AAF654_10700 [Myxococcota bacterium]
MTDNVLPLQNPGANDAEVSPLDAIVREGARRLLQAALDNEVAEVIAGLSNVVDDKGRRVVVRNGHLPERELVTGAGPVKVKQPRVRDRSGPRFSASLRAAPRARSCCIQPNKR